MGYETNDFQKKIIDPIDKRFNGDFYTEKPNPWDKSPNQIENAVVKLYNYYSLDLGIHKIEEHYTAQFLEDLNQDSISTRLIDSLEWLLFLMHNKAISHNLLKKIDGERTIEVIVDEMDEYIQSKI